MGISNSQSSGPLQRMANRECERVSHRYECFRESWDRRDLGRAVVNFERFCEVQSLHMKWEEDTVLAEFEKRCRGDERAEISRHRTQHQVATLLTERVARLLAVRMGLGAKVDDELAPAIGELERLLCTHRASELNEVCARLDAVLSDVELCELEDECAHRIPAALTD